jgi:solute carrier family 45 protein 1/2/4
LGSKASQARKSYTLVPFSLHLEAPQVSSTAIAIAVIAFYLLDFALNALQASLRNLLLDVTPPAQLNAGNAWHGRMTHAGNIVGFGFGL